MQQEERKKREGRRGGDHGLGEKKKAWSVKKTEKERKEKEEGMVGWIGCGEGLEKKEMKIKEKVVLGFDVKEEKEEEGGGCRWAWAGEKKKRKKEKKKEERGEERN